jgi:hypothetical protein
VGKRRIERMDSEDLGSRILIAGHTGSGKSYIAGYILKMFSPAGRMAPIDEQPSYQPDSDVRKAVELHAVRVAKSWMEDQGFSVQVKGKPYDLLCIRRDGEVRYVEVKGLQGPAQKIILTSNEVKFARENSDRMILIVVSDILLSRDGAGKVRTSGGKMNIRDSWAPRPESLEAIAFNYAL